MVVRCVYLTSSGECPTTQRKDRDPLAAIHSPVALQHPTIRRRTPRGWGPPRLNVFNFSKRLQVSRAEPLGSWCLVSLHARTERTLARSRRQSARLSGTCRQVVELLGWNTSSDDYCGCSPELSRRTTSYVDVTLHPIASLSDKRWMMSTFFSHDVQCTPLIDL